MHVSTSQCLKTHSATCSFCVTAAIYYRTEKRVCKERGTLVFISFPSRAHLPQAITCPCTERGEGGFIGKRRKFWGRWGYSGCWKECVYFAHLVDTIENMLCFGLFELGGEWCPWLMSDSWAESEWGELISELLLVEKKKALGSIEKWKIGDFWKGFSGHHWLMLNSSNKNISICWKEKCKNMKMRTNIIEEFKNVWYYVHCICVVQHKAAHCTRCMLNIYFHKMNMAPQKN